MNEFPGRLRQIKNFLKGRSEIKHSQTEYKPRAIQSGILYGLETLIPQEIKSSGILQNQDRLRMVDDLLAYQVRMNDRIDFTYSGRNDIADIKAECVNQETQAKINLDLSLGTINSPEIKTIILNSFKEVEVIEQYIHFKRGRLSFDEVEKYRNLVNAISNCAVTASILGPQSKLLERLKPLSSEDLTWQGIYKKYAWVFDDNSSNNVEKTIMIMHNLGMAGQIDDDWYGKHIDRTLGIDSLANAAMEEKQQNQSQAKEFLDGIKKAYLDKTESLGLSSLGIKIIDTFQKRLQKTMSWCTRKARFSNNQSLSSWLKQNITSKMGVREKAFADGRL